MPAPDVPAKQGADGSAVARRGPSDLDAAAAGQLARAAVMKPMPGGLSRKIVGASRVLSELGGATASKVLQ